MVKRALLMVLALLMVVTIACRPAEPTPEPDVPLKLRFKVLEGPSYSQDIQPIFDQFCVGCHGPERAENGLRLNSYENTMKGTQYGPVVIPGQSSFSTLVYVIHGLTSTEISMPYRDHSLTTNRVENIRYWIDFGAQNN